MEPIVVHILDKELRVACPPDEREALHAAALDLDRRMRQIRNQSRSLSLESLALMSALNLAGELLQAREREQQLEALTARLKTLSSRLERRLQNE